jgi:hypothetical protein
VLRPLRLLTLLAALAAVLGLAACGSAKDSSGDFQGEQQKVAKVVEQLQKQGRNRDATKICSELLAPALVKQIETAATKANAKQTSCAKVLKTGLNDADSFELQVKKVQITGTRAAVTVSSEAGGDKRIDQLTLQKVGAAWKIATLGSVS